MASARWLLQLLAVLGAATLTSALDFTISRPAGGSASLDPAVADALGVDPAAHFYGTIAAAEAADMCEYFSSGGTATDAFVDYGSRTRPYHMKLVKTVGCSRDRSPAGSQSLFDISGTNQQVAVICGPDAGTESDVSGSCDTFVAVKKPTSSASEEL